jgi:exonuclease III
MHGYNQGISMLQSLCDHKDLNIDCILIQEHWLTPNNLGKIKSFNNYSFYGISAMEKAVSISVLKGRPYGGVGILIKNTFCKNVDFHKAGERFSIIAFNKVLLVSVYLPSVLSDSDVNIVMDIISEIEAVIDMLPGYEIIFGGDFNMNLLNEKSTAALLINNFFVQYGLKICCNIMSANSNIIDYTYCHQTLGYSSYIDYFAVSDSLIKYVLDFDILDHALNLSDHNPILLRISINNIPATVNHEVSFKKKQCE